MAYNTYLQSNLPPNGFHSDFVNPNFQQRQEFMPAQQQIAPQPGMGFVCRPVTSRAEAEAIQCEYFGPGTLMPDLAHGMVYLKRFNRNTGTSEMFDFASVPPAAAATPEYVTKETVDEIKQNINRLAEELDKIKKGKVKKDETN